jgi:MFS family permease
MSDEKQQTLAMSNVTHVENTVKTDSEGNYLEDDPHRAALEDNPDRPERLTWGVCLSILFLSLAFVPSLTCGFILPAGILVQIGTELGDTANIAWIPGGWSIASSVSFSIAGNISDIFGRRHVIIIGQALALVGLVSVPPSKQRVRTTNMSCLDCRCNSEPCDQLDWLCRPHWFWVWYALRVLRRSTRDASKQMAVRGACYVSEFLSN